MEEKDIPKQIADAIFGYGPEYLSKCMYAYEMEQYKKAMTIERQPGRPKEENARDYDNVLYYGKRMDACHKCWIALQDIEEEHPYTL